MAKPRIGRKLVVEASQTTKRHAAQLLWAFGCLGWLLGASGVLAAQHRAAPKPVTSGTVRTIVDGDTVILRSGVQVRLVGIQAPKLPLGRRGFRAWPLADAAKAALSRLTSDRPVGLSYGGRKSDRHGRLLAHLTTPDGTWVQGALLNDGMARVYTFPDNRGRAKEMLALERQARSARRGIWAHPFYRLRSADDLRRDLGTFQLIEGTVVSAVVVRGRAYLNFGQNWRNDFTISISPKWRRRHWTNGPPVADYEGRNIRVRGWLKSFNGPMIEATHPEQIEILP